jgi:hypothetical protein
MSYAPELRQVELEINVCCPIRYFRKIRLIARLTRQSGRTTGSRTPRRSQAITAVVRQYMFVCSCRNELFYSEVHNL